VFGIGIFGRKFSGHLMKNNSMTLLHLRIILAGNDASVLERNKLVGVTQSAIVLLLFGVSTGV
jgi:hypothetical protein